MAAEIFPKNLRDQAEVLAWLCNLVYQPCEIWRTTVRSRFEHVDVHPVIQQNAEAMLLDPKSVQMGALPGAPFKYVIIRGTQASLHSWSWQDVFRNISAPEMTEYGGPTYARVHRGYYDYWNKLYNELVHHYNLNLSQIGTPVIVAGHSLGGAVAHISAHLPRVNTVWSFGAPRAGNAFWARSLEIKNKIWRFVYDKDIAPNHPTEKEGFRHPVGKYISISSLRYDDYGPEIRWRERYLPHLVGPKTGLRYHAIGMYHAAMRGIQL